VSLVVTLVGERRGALTREIIEAVAQGLDAAGHGVGDTDWLAADEAADLTIENGNRDAVLSATAAAIGSAPIDVAVQPAADRRKRLLVADMDSTIIAQECIDELAAAVGLRDTVSAITERAMRGEIDFEDALRERAAMLAGLDIAAMSKVLEERIVLNPGARTLVSTMRTHGAYTALVSGGFTFFTNQVRKRAGFDADRANELEFEGEMLTGRVREPILGRAAKLDALKALTGEHGLRETETMALGDGANDLAMIQAAGLGVAYHAKPAVAAQADVTIRYGDLHAVLFVQGYRRDEFVSTAA